RDDGSLVWIATSVQGLKTPDFQGGLVVSTLESIARHDPVTGQLSTLFTTTSHDPVHWATGLVGDPAIHQDGTILTVEYTCHDFCDGADATDGGWVVGVNPGGGEKFRVLMQNNVTTDRWRSSGDVAFCAVNESRTLVTTYDHAWPQVQMRI